MTIMINKLIYKGGVTKPFGKFSLSHSGRNTEPEFYSIFTTLLGILNPDGQTLKQSSSSRFSFMRIITRVSSSASGTWGNCRSQSGDSGVLGTFHEFPSQCLFPDHLGTVKWQVFPDTLLHDASAWLPLVPELAEYLPRDVCRFILLLLDSG